MARFGSGQQNVLPRGHSVLYGMDNAAGVGLRPELSGVAKMASKAAKPAQIPANLKPKKNKATVIPPAFFGA